MRCGPLVSLVLFAFVLSGCIGAQDPPLEASERHEDESTPEDGSGPDHRPPTNWADRFEHEGTVDSHLCLDILFCTVLSEADDPLQLSYDNATTVRLELVVEWDEENGNGADRILTVECWDGQGGDCTDFPGPLQTRGGPPITLIQNDLQVPPRTTMNITVTLEDQAPDPLIYRYDEVVAFTLTGEALLETMHDG